MSRSLGYTKKFIIFKKDFSNMTGFNPKGYGKIEIKGLKGSLSISLEKAEEEQVYSVMIVDREKEFELGKVYTEKNGKGREELTFNISDLEASGFSIDKLNGIVISRGKNVLLGGYLDKEDGSLENYISSLLLKEEPVVNMKAVELEGEESSPVGKIPNEIEEAPEAVEEEPASVEENYVEEVEPYVEASDQTIESEEIIPEAAEKVPEVEEVPGAIEKIPNEVEEVSGEVEEVVEEVGVETIETEDSFEPLENAETNIELNQFIEVETGDDFEPEFEPIMEINQELEIEAIEPEDIEYEEIESEVIEPESIEPESIESDSIEPEAVEPEEIFVEPEPMEEFGSVAVEYGEAFEPINPEDFETEAIEPEIGEFESEPELIEPETIEPETIEYETIEPETMEPEIVEFESDPVAEEIEPLEELEPLMEYRESNEEVLEIKNMDYERNRRIIQRNQTTSYILNILRYFAQVDPFRINLDGYSWWRIDYQYEDKGFLPYFGYVVNNGQSYARQNYITTATDLMSSYGHYLFGMYESGNEVKYYVYAAPGAFYKDEHPHSGATGFNTWYPGSEITGYWLLYIDALTGEVVYPINPMISTE